MNNNFTNLPRLDQSIAVVAGLLFACFAGVLVGGNAYIPLVGLSGLICVALVCLWLRTTIWLLIPICWLVTGRVSILPLPFSIRDLSVMLVAGMFCFFFALKLVRLRSRFGWLEILVILNILNVAMMYVRHPVGTRAFASSMVGGRPYFDTLVGLIAFLILREMVISRKHAKWFPLLMAGSSVMITGVSYLTRSFPSLTPFIAPFYSGFNIDSYRESEGAQKGDSRPGQRYTEFVGIGTCAVQALCTYFKPNSLLLPSHPVRMLLLCAAMVGMLFTGFRSAIFGVALFFLFSSYFQGGMPDLVRTVGLGIVAVLLLAVVQTLGPGIPLQAQRALSFIPFIPWDEAQKGGAEESTEWRVEMWKTVLIEDQYIRDKVFGDGFGFSARELAIQLDAVSGGTGYIGGAKQEAQMITGAFHSGPLSTIRFGGIVGLILYMILSIYLSFQAPGLIRKTQGTPLKYLGIYFAIPLIYAPLVFVFVFGAYETAVPEILFTAGIFRLIQNSLEQYPSPALNTLPVQSREDAGIDSAHPA